MLVITSLCAVLLFLAVSRADIPDSATSSGGLAESDGGEASFGTSASASSGHHLVISSTSASGTSSLKTVVESAPLASYSNSARISPTTSSSSASAVTSGSPGAKESGPSTTAPEAVAPGPSIFIVAGNYTLVESAGKSCEYRWGGFGGGTPGVPGRSFGFTLEGGSDSWAETFEYSTFEKPEGGEDWAAFDKVNVTVKNALRATYRCRLEQWGRLQDNAFVGMAWDDPVLSVDHPQIRGDCIKVCKGRPC